MKKEGIRYLLLVFLFIFFIYVTNRRFEKIDDKIASYTEFSENKIDSLQGVIDSLNVSAHGITATMYNPLKGQTDSTPNQLADGTYIRIDRASEYNYIAVSRDLLKSNGGLFEMGDIVFVYGAGHKNGMYQIRDKMNLRFKKRIDFLETPNTTYYKYSNVRIKKLIEKIRS